MHDLQRQVTTITALGKRYSGNIGIPNSAPRTTDLFNTSSTTSWKNQQQAGYLTRFKRRFSIESDFIDVNTNHIAPSSLC